MLTIGRGHLAFGGRPIGALLLNQNKHFRLEAVFAIQIAIPSDRIVSGLRAWALAKKFLFPYAGFAIGKR